MALVGGVGWCVTFGAVTAPCRFPEAGGQISLVCCVNPLEQQPQLRAAPTGPQTSAGLAASEHTRPAHWPQI